MCKNHHLQVCTLETSYQGMPFFLTISDPQILLTNLFKGLMPPFNGSFELDIPYNMSQKNVPCHGGNF